MKPVSGLPNAGRHSRRVFSAIISVLWLGALAMPVFAAFWTQPQLLEPERAFQLSARAVDAKTVELRYRIADGYYMYRHGFKVETAAGRAITNVDLPAGLAKKDPFFGETRIYEREAVLHMPLATIDTQRGRVKLKITSQGCAEVGVCYVPHDQVVEVALPASGATR